MERNDTLLAFPIQQFTTHFNVNMHLAHWTDPLPETAGTLAKKDIHIWRFDLAALRSAEQLQLLSNDEKIHLSAIKHAKHARQYANTRFYLRHILSRYLDAPASGLEFSVAPGGKPQLKNTDLQFNLSHSHELGLLAIHISSPIGIDLEKNRPARQLHKIAKRLFPDYICAQITQGTAAEQQTAFFHEWTAMEARQKSRGRGIFNAVVDPQGVHCQHFVPEAGYIAAIAVEKNNAPLSIRFLNSSASAYDADRP
jgi:4'-phosphopantetheinyl transferase